MFIWKILTQVTVGENEGIESALRRFKRQVSKSGIFADLKRLRHHETPIEKYKRKLQQRRKARRRWFGKDYKFFKIYNNIINFGLGPVIKNLTI